MIITEICPAIREQERESNGLHCKKSHQSFISINSLETTAPAEFQEDVSLNTIKAVANLTAKIQQRPSSEYVNHKKCVSLTSSGFIKNWVVTNGTCCCSKCKNSTEPSQNWAKIEIYTASHAVTPGKADSLICTLFCDGSNKEKTTLRVAKVIEKGSDLCILQCHTCDSELIMKLESLLQVYRASSEKLHKKYEQVAGKDKPVFIVSHPHGGPKKVSFGHLVTNEIITDTSPFLSYSNATCVGSSGSLVFIAGNNNWIIHIGSRVCRYKGVNVGIGRIASIHDQESFFWIESQIELESIATMNVYVVDEKKRWGIHNFDFPTNVTIDGILIDIQEYLNITKNCCLLLKVNNKEVILDNNHTLRDYERFLDLSKWTLILREKNQNSQTNDSYAIEDTKSITAGFCATDDTKTTTAGFCATEDTKTINAEFCETEETKTITAAFSLAFEEYKSSMTKSGREYFEKTEVAAKVLKRKFPYDKSFLPGMSLIQQCLHTHFQMINSIIESMSQTNYHPGQKATNQCISVYTTKKVSFDDNPEYKALRRIYKYVIDNIEANDLIDKLFEIQVIDFHLKVEIRLMANRKDRNRRLVDIILEGCPETFKKFLASLKTNYDYMADKLLYEYEKENETKAITYSQSEADEIHHENHLQKRLKIKNQSNTSTEDK